MSSVARNQIFSAVHTVGGLLPGDMLARISEGKDVAGSRPADYGVVGARSVRDEAERHWDYLKSLWRELRERLPPAPEGELPADPTGLATSTWLLPLFAELGFGALTELSGFGITSDDGSKTFPISHRWNHVPLHLTAWPASLDKRSGGAGTVPAQSLVQECLNRTEAHLWGVVTNGRQLRLLRDSSALATASYVEFDLEAIFDGELFSEFVLLYRLVQVSRFAVADGAAPSTCWLERWRLDAIKSGIRALDQLCDGVEQAITTLGTGFLRHPANTALRENLDIDTLHNALLRLVYRLLFVFVAEDRDVLHGPDTSARTRQRYATYFSTTRLRAHARRRKGTTHDDLYRALCIVLDALGDERGRPELGLPGLGGIFDNTDADAVLHGLSLSNDYLLSAVRHIAQVRDLDSGRLRSVDYRHLDAEELGSIYESLLERVPKHSPAERTFKLVPLAGNTRKSTGSYYTPSSLIECLLDSTLDPVIDDAVKRGEQTASAAGHSDPAESIVAELLSLTVCDPACGSGHFLVAAARRIAKRVASVRERNPEPTLDAVRHALHEVIARCIYGVDLNPMAVELAKVALWLEAMEPGKPLSFLDAHIKCGNALIGATPALLRDGIPNTAFKFVEGDERSVANSFFNQNEKERSGQYSLFERPAGTKVPNTVFGEKLRRITQAPADTLTEVHQQAIDYRAWENSADYLRACHVADAWCAAFMWHKTKDAPPPITHDIFRSLQDGGSAGATAATHEEIVRLRTQYRFLHWHLAFPDIFTVSDHGSAADSITGWEGGFSCVLSNPPWDKIDFEDKKYFSMVAPSIAAISGTARRTKIDQWVKENPEEGGRYHAERRKKKSSFLFGGSSGSFPLCGKGLSIKGVNSLQTDQLFTERFTTIVSPAGRIGCIVPTAIATGAGAQYLFSNLTRHSRIKLLYDFENRKPIFIGVHSSYRFCLLSLTGRGTQEPATAFAFFLAEVADLADADHIVALTSDDLDLINPNSGNLPNFRNPKDAELTAAIHRRIPVLWNEGEKSGNPWQVKFKNLFNMTDDSDIFSRRDELEKDGWKLDRNVFVRNGKRMLPLYEAKMVHHFDHRWNSYFGTEDDERRRIAIEEKREATTVANPRYWIVEDGFVGVVRKSKEVEVLGVERRLARLHWDRDWLCGWRDVCRATDERTAIPSFIPRTAVGHTLPLMVSHLPTRLIATLVAAQSSLVLDFVSRQKVAGIHMALMIWKQLPVPTPEMMEPHAAFIVPRLLELVYTAYDMRGLARDLDDSRGPFRWSDERRTQMRAELDAYFFHLYGIGRADADYILETFQSDSGGGLKNNEIAKYGTYRTKELVLAEYDRMAGAGLTLTTPLVDGENYTSTLTPPPGQGPRHPEVD